MGGYLRCPALGRTNQSFLGKRCWQKERLHQACPKRAERKGIRRCASAARRMQDKPQIHTRKTRVKWLPKLTNPVHHVQGCCDDVAGLKGRGNDVGRDHGARIHISLASVEPCLGPYRTAMSVSKRQECKARERKVEVDGREWWERERVCHNGDSRRKWTSSTLRVCDAASPFRSSCPCPTIPSPRYLIRKSPPLSARTGTARCPARTGLSEPCTCVFRS